jgi:hypothetical protein
VFASIPEGEPNTVESTPSGIKDLLFTSYALVGLENYFKTNPDKFIDRLSKGPPTEYRWLAWRFMARQIQNKKKGHYEDCLRALSPGAKPLHDIDKDVNRTFPVH